jgi:hypothetical protein
MQGLQHWRRSSRASSIKQLPHLNLNFRGCKQLKDAGLAALAALQKC